jgi:hypothetical protein
VHPLYQQQQQQRVPGSQAPGAPSQQQHQAAGQTASPAARQWSPGTSGTLGEDDGEFVEQPSDPEDQASSSSRVRAGQQPLSGASGGSAAGAGSSGGDSAAGREPVPAMGTLQQHGSPGSCSDEDAVLLERE